MTEECLIWIVRAATEKKKKKKKNRKITEDHGETGKVPTNKNEEVEKDAEYFNTISSTRLC